VRDKTLIKLKSQLLKMRKIVKITLVDRVKMKSLERVKKARKINLSQ